MLENRDTSDLPLSGLTVLQHGLLFLVLVGLNALALTVTVVVESDAIAGAVFGIGLVCYFALAYVGGVWRQDD